MICEMRGGQGWWRKRMNCKVLCSYKATPLALAAPSSVGLGTEGVDGSGSGWGSRQSRSEVISIETKATIYQVIGTAYCREHSWSSEGNKSLNLPPTSVPSPLNLENINSLCRNVYWFLRTVADLKNPSVPVCQVSLFQGSRGQGQTLDSDVEWGRLLVQDRAQVERRWEAGMAHRPEKWESGCKSMQFQSWSDRPLVAVVMAAVRDSHFTYVWLAQKGPAFCLMLCWCYLEICNFF